MINDKKIKECLRKTTKEQRKEAYEKAKKETILKYPTMVEFFRFIERKDAQKSGAETPLKSDNKKE